MKIGEFFISLLVDADQGKLTISGLITSMGQLEAATVGELGVLFELAQGLGRLTEVSVKNALGYKYLTATTNESVESFQKWSIAAGQAGIEGSKIAPVMKSLNDQLEAGKRGEGFGNLIVLSRLFGIDLSKLRDANDLFVKMRASQKFQEMPAPTKAFWLRSAGLPDFLTPLFDVKTLPDKKIKEALASIGGVMNKDEMDRFVTIGTQFTLIEEQTKRIGEEIANWISPSVISGLNATIAVLKMAHETLGETKKTIEAHPKETAIAKEAFFASIASPFGLLPSLMNLKNSIAALDFMRTPVASNPLAFATAGGPSLGRPNVSVVNHNNIPITTKASPADIKRHVEDALNLQNTKVFHMFDNGPQ